MFADTYTIQLRYFCINCEFSLFNIVSQKKLCYNIFCVILKTFFKFYGKVRRYGIIF